MRLRPGRRLQYLKKGDEPKFLRAEFANMFIALFNALMNLRINNGKFLISDDAMAIDGQAGSSATAGNLQTYRVKSKIDDVLICRTWNGTTEGSTDVPIATSFNSRQLSSETINSITYTYTAYTDIGDGFNYSRTSTSSGDSSEEEQIVTPMWYLNCLISVSACNYSGVTYDDTVNPPYDLKLIEVSARCWAMIEPPE